MKSSVYETPKIHVTIRPEYVLKVFKKCPGYKSRYKKEKQALMRLSDIQGIPQLISYSDEHVSLKISRLPGCSPKRMSDKSLLQLKSLVNHMLKQGIARHSLPIRDILIDEHDNVGLVDFERTTIKSRLTLPIWHLAHRIARFHLYRLIHSHNSRLLSIEEKCELEQGLKFRARFARLRHIRDQVRQLWR